MLPKRECLQASKCITLRGMFYFKWFNRKSRHFQCSQIVAHLQYPLSRLVCVQVFHHSHVLPHAWVTVDLAGKAATAIAYPKPSRKPSKELGWYMWVCWVGFKKATAYSELRGRGQYCLISFQWCRRLPSEHFENKYCLICYSSIIISSSESFVVLLLADITALVEVTELVWGFNKISSQIFTFSSIAYWPFSLLHCF